MRNEKRNLNTQDLQLMLITLRSSNVIFKKSPEKQLKTTHRHGRKYSENKKTEQFTDVKDRKKFY